MSLVLPQQAVIRPSSRPISSHQGLRCGKLTHASGNVTLDSLPFAGLSSQQQQPVDQPGPEICPAVKTSEAGVRSLESEFCSCRDEPAVTSDTGDNRGLWHFYTSWQCFRIYSSHVLLAGPPRKCVFLLHCVPFHSFVVEPGLHLRHLCLSFIQLHQKRRIQGRWKEPQRLSQDDQDTAKIAHTLVNQQQHKLGDLFWYFLHLWLREKTRKKRYMYIFWGANIKYFQIFNSSIGGLSLKQRDPCKPHRPEVSKVSSYKLSHIENIILCLISNQFFRCLDNSEPF